MAPLFKLATTLKPAGDQSKAISALNEGLKKGFDKQTLLGVTGSGKTFTAANVIANYGKPTLVIAHNKTLAAQLAQEYREFFPDNAVHYFVSYYDYYQPEAYIPSSDTYIEKEAMIKEKESKIATLTQEADDLAADYFQILDKNVALTEQVKTLEKQLGTLNSGVTTAR